MAAGGPGYSVGFDSTGRRMVAGEANGIVRVWEVSPAPLPVPTWFLGFSEALAGIRVSSRGNVELVPRQELQRLTELILSENKDGYYERVARWFLVAPEHRPLSPF